MPAQYVIVDKGYDSTILVETAERADATAAIPPRVSVKALRATDFSLDAERYRIECIFNRLKHDRAVATGYARRARNLASFIYLATSILWIK